MEYQRLRIGRFYPAVGTIEHVRVTLWVAALYISILRGGLIPGVDDHEALAMIQTLPSVAYWHDSRWEESPYSKVALTALFVTASGYIRLYE